MGKFLVLCTFSPHIVKKNKQYKLNSILCCFSGRCYPGWRLYENKCYLYFGGVIPYHEAQLECKVRADTASDICGKLLIKRFQRSYFLEHKIRIGIHYTCTYMNH